MSTFSAAERQRIMQEARANIQAAQNMPARDLADLPAIVAKQAWFTPEIEPEPEPERTAMDRDVERVVSMVAEETRQQLDQHRAFVEQLLAELVRGLVDESVEFFGKHHRAIRDDIDALRTEVTVLKTDNARLHASIASLEAELSRRSAAQLDSVLGDVRAFKQ